MKKMIKGLTILLTMVAINNVHGVEQATPLTTITSIVSYTKFGNGDVRISVANPATNCDAGFWLSPADPGFNANLSVLLSAYHSKSTVTLNGEDTQIWTGSVNKHCRLLFIELI